MAKDLMWVLAVMVVSHTCDLAEAVARKLHLYQNVDVIEQRLNVSWTFQTDLAAVCTAKCAIMENLCGGYRSVEKIVHLCLTTVLLKVINFILFTMIYAKVLFAA